jgi:hypothetical protein
VGVDFLIRFDCSKPREGLMYLLTREEAWKRAADCAARAEVAFDDETRLLFLRMRDRWLSVANNPELFDVKTPVGRRPDTDVVRADDKAA